MPAQITAQPELRPVVFRGQTLAGYVVDTAGRVFSRWERAPTEDGRIRFVVGDGLRELAPCKVGKGGRYLGVALLSGGRKYRTTVHALVAQTFPGRPGKRSDTSTETATTTGSTTSVTEPAPRTTPTR